MAVRVAYGAAVLVVCAGLAACGTESASSAPTAAPTTVTTATPTTTTPPDVEEWVPMDPADLIGTWAVKGTDETEAITMTVGVYELQIWRTCGEQGGQWRASTTGLFVANTTFWEMPCRDSGDTPTWLTTATSFAVEGDAILLRNADEETAATLVPGETPTSADEFNYLATPPPVTDEIRAHLGRTTPLPAQLEPATPERLLGRWLPADGSGAGAPEQPHAEFRANGSWSGTDGCNGQGGRWVADDGGALLATQGAQTAVGCRDMVSVGGWVVAALVAGFDGEVLVLIGVDGAETGRLVRG